MQMRISQSEPAHVPNSQHEQLERRIRELDQENKRLRRELLDANSESLLFVTEHERDLALEAYRESNETVKQQQQQIDTLTNERDYARMELQRAQSDREEVKQLRKRIASILAICAVPHEQVGPYEKLALITAPAQVPYSAAIHGGNSETMLTSMKKWNVAIGGSDENTHCLNRALKPLEAIGTVKREKVNVGDGRTHFTVEVNEQHLNHPRLINPETPRKHNGGDKRCPQCNGKCKTNIVLTYECVPCGLEFDRDMKPIDHLSTQVVTPEPGNIVDFLAFQQTVLTDVQLDVFNPKKARK